MSYVSFFGVYDGHGGSETADFLRDNLHINFAKALKSGRKPYRNRLAQALRVAFRKTDQALLTKYREEEKMGKTFAEESSGAAAAVVVLQGRKMVVAHVGDCRAVLCRARAGAGGGGTVDHNAHHECVELTADHKYSNVSERERVQQGGGCWEHNRLNSILEVSRAFGDYDFTSGCKHRGLSADPEIREHALAPEDEFLVLASDGLWSSDGAHGPASPADHRQGSDDPGWRGKGFRSGKEVVRFIRRQLRTNNNNAGQTVESVVEEAIKCDESDNTTAIMICFRPLEQAPVEPVKQIHFSNQRPRFFNSNKPPRPAADQAPAPASSP
mmetsp:Transcript_22276/g.60853  ORF Transcript_22276/g.60853 Transcript_22276/m.60853 type:complete len:327 (-) Transcript_22276:2-982(-)